MFPTTTTCNFFFPFKEYLKEQLFSMNSSKEKPLPTRPLKTTLKSVEDQPSAFNPFHVYRAFSENMLDQVCNGKFNFNCVVSLH